MMSIARTLSREAIQLVATKKPPILFEVEGARTSIWGRVGLLSFVHSWKRKIFLCILSQLKF
eukprot:1614230-Ditylum_brightwellii.AAC.1